MSVKVMIEQLQADKLLEGTTILEQIKGLSSMFVYETTEGPKSLKDYFELLRLESFELPSVELKSHLVKAEASAYSVKLLQAVETVSDSIERIHLKAVWFNSRIKNIQSYTDTIRTTFLAWYSIALADALQSIPKVKITAQMQKALAESEFSRLVDNQDLNLNELVDALGVLIDSLKSHKKLVTEKYNMGRDQVNVILSSSDFGTDGFVGGNNDLLKKVAGAVPNTTVKQRVEVEVETEGDERDTVEDEPQDGEDLSSQEELAAPVSTSEHESFTMDEPVSTPPEALVDPMPTRTLEVAEVISTPPAPVPASSVDLSILDRDDNDFLDIVPAEEDLAPAENLAVSAQQSLPTERPSDVDETPSQPEEKALTGMNVQIDKQTGMRFIEDAFAGRIDLDPAPLEEGLDGEVPVAEVYDRPVVERPNRSEETVRARPRVKVTPPAPVSVVGVVTDGNLEDVDVPVSAEHADQGVAQEKVQPSPSVSGRGTLFKPRVNSTQNVQGAKFGELEELL